MPERLSLLVHLLHYQVLWWPLLQPVPLLRLGLRRLHQLRQLLWMLRLQRHWCHR